MATKRNRKLYFFAAIPNFLQLVMRVLEEVWSIGNLFLTTEKNLGSTYNAIKMRNGKLLLAAAFPSILHLASGS